MNQPLKSLAFISIVLSAVVVLSACSSGADDPTPPTPPTSSTQTPSTTTNDIGDPTNQPENGDETRLITLAEVARNSDSSSCYLVIENQVYDVTSYIRRHPGGNTILQGCGQADATALFDTKGGRGGGHSSQAKSLLSDYLIGQLVP